MPTPVRVRPLPPVRQVAQRETLENGCELLTYDDGSILLSCEGDDERKSFEELVAEQIEAMSEPDRTILKRRLGL